MLNIEKNMYFSSQSKLCLCHPSVNFLGVPLKEYNFSHILQC